MPRIAGLALFAFCLAAASAAEPVPTGKLPRNVVPTTIALELRVDPDKDHFSGRVEIGVEILQATDTLWLHGRALTIERAELTFPDGRVHPLQVEQAHVSGVLRLTAKQALQPGSATVGITYSAPYGGLQGAYKVSADGENYVMTQMEPIGARNVFPGFDEPDFKHPWHVTLVIPASDTAVANTRLIGDDALPNGWHKLRFAPTENLPSYLIAFAVGPLDIVEWQDIPPNEIRAAPLNLRGIALKGRAKQMSYALESTASIVAAQERYFGIAYPFDKLDVLATPDFAFGAMENAGLIVYRESLMFANEQSPTDLRQAMWSVHAHEIAHQWFGNLVTMRWWDDIWLNEGFATWFAGKIVHGLHPEFHRDRVRVENSLSTMQEDSLDSARRIRQPIDDFTDIQSAFDGITYRKGAAVLAMFERFLGEESFRDGIRAYLRDHARGNATSADLFRSLASGREDAAEVRAGFASFTDQTGVPLLRIERSCADGKTRLEIGQERYLPIGSRADKHLHWSLPLCVRFAQGTASKTQCQLISESTTVVMLDSDSCPAWIMPNADGAGYYRFVLGAADRVALGEAFSRLGENEQQAYADSLVAAFRTGAIDATQFLAAVPQLMGAAARQTTAAALGRLEWMHWHLTDATNRAAFRAHVGKLVRPRFDSLGLEAKPGESDDDRLLREELTDFLAFVALDAVLLERLGDRGRGVLGLGGMRLAADGKLRADAVPADERAAVLMAAAQRGDATTYDTIERHLRASEDAVLRGHLLAALGKFRDPELAARARALAFEPGTLRRNELQVVPLTQMGTRELGNGVRQWIDKNFVALAAQLDPRGASLVGTYAIGLCSDDAARALETTFRDRARELEGGPRAVAQAAEVTRLCSALREAQLRHGFGSALD